MIGIALSTMLTASPVVSTEIKPEPPPDWRLTLVTNNVGADIGVERRIVDDIFFMIAAGMSVERMALPDIGVEQLSAAAEAQGGVRLVALRAGPLQLSLSALLGLAGQTRQSSPQLENPLFTFFSTGAAIGAHADIWVIDNLAIRAQTEMVNASIGFAQDSSHAIRGGLFNQSGVGLVVAF